MGHTYEFVTSIGKYIRKTLPCDTFAMLYAQNHGLKLCGRCCGDIVVSIKHKGVKYND